MQVKIVTESKSVFVGCLGMETGGGKERRKGHKETCGCDWYVDYLHWVGGFTYQIVPFKYKQLIVCQSYLYEAVKNTGLLLKGSISINVKYKDVRNFIKFMSTCLYIYMYIYIYTYIERERQRIWECIDR